MRGGNRIRWREKGGVQRKRNGCSNVRLIAGIDFLAGRTGLNKTNDLYYPPLEKYSASSFIIYKIYSEAILF